MREDWADVLGFLAEQDAIVVLGVPHPVESDEKTPFLRVT